MQLVDDFKKTLTEEERDYITEPVEELMEKLVTWLYQKYGSS